jgi:hypothetical protein
MLTLGDVVIVKALQLSSLWRLILLPGEKDI